jgi:hypothetical protein
LRPPQGCDNPNPASVSPTGVSRAAPTPAGLLLSGFPYGTYNVCAEAKVSGATRHETVVGAALNALPSVRSRRLGRRRRHHQRDGLVSVGGLRYAPPRA